MRQAFLDNEPLEASGRDACSGATANDDFRFLRLLYEVHPKRIAQRREETDLNRWYPLAKGGEHSRFYSDLYLVVDWGANGRAVKAHIADYRGRRGWGYQWSAALNGHANYFRPGLTWSRRSQTGLSLRAMPEGGLFGDKGPAVFVPNDNSEDLLFLLGVTNSQPFRDLVEVQMAFGSYEVGVLERSPLPSVHPAERAALTTLVRRAWSLKRNLDTPTETSHVFTLPALLQVHGSTLSSRAAVWREHVDKVLAELASIQSEIDERCFHFYGLEEADRVAIGEGLVTGIGRATESEQEVESDAETDPDTVTARLAEEVVSWVVGVAFGRFDLRLATGERAMPIESKPFEPLPISASGALTDFDDLHAHYALPIPTTGILVDDPGHPRDLNAAVRAVFDMVFGASADAWWSEAGALLNTNEHGLRSWLASSFFEHHLKHHSRSRRKAPILWQSSGLVARRCRPTLPMRGYQERTLWRRMPPSPMKQPHVHAEQARCYASQSDTPASRY